MAVLAINGGQPYRRQPFPSRTPFGDREIELLTEAVRSQNLFGLGGKMVSAFEKGFAALYGAKYAVGSTSGTAAIHVAIGTIDPDPGDEIISAPITDGGGIVPVLYQNAIPVFADIDSSFNMDPRD
ncbi:MAG: DegT/DnrJ/EryC1/StrS family aminotransferase, partial [Anaerolineae bacterium]